MLCHYVTAVLSSASWTVLQPKNRLYKCLSFLPYKFRVIISKSRQSQMSCKQSNLANTKHPTQLHISKRSSWNRCDEFPTVCNPKHHRVQKKLPLGSDPNPVELSSQFHTLFLQYHFNNILSLTSKSFYSLKKLRMHFSFSPCVPGFMSHNHLVHYGSHPYSPFL
jgi:hypothetical protein